MNNKKIKVPEKYYGPICDVCEKPIKGGVFSPFHYDKDGIPSATCDKHATHFEQWAGVIDGVGQITIIEKTNKENDSKNKEDIQSS